MRYNKLGQTGMMVSELCLGAMTFGTKPGGFFQHDCDQAASTALVKQALDAGVNFIDTANVYSEGQSEEFTGQALRDRDGFKLQSFFLCRGRTLSTRCRP